MSGHIVLGAARRYDWGSTKTIQDLLGQRRNGKPIAELWFGAHPDEPSMTFDGPLSEIIAADPVAMLGRQAVEYFSGQLPYLVKILAVAKPLSIQVHPDLAQARRGHAREQALGEFVGLQQRSYRDANHKPELIVAQSEFEALVGFRPIEETIRLIDDLPGLAPLVDLLREDGLYEALSAVLNLEQETVANLCASAPTWPDELSGARQAVQAFPGDPGGLVGMLMNHVRLAPGEGVYVDSGIMHAYLRGTGVEIMANSDNVLRAGCTSKHVDIDGVLAITDFEPRPVQVLRTDSFVPPVPDFRLDRLELSDGEMQLQVGPCLVLCTEGMAQVDGTWVSPGQAVFVPASSDVVSLRGTEAEVFIATDNLEAS